MNVFNTDVFLPTAPVVRAAEPRRPTYTDVYWSAPVQWTTRNRYKGSQKLGLAYEQRVVDVLSAIYSSCFVRSPTIRYKHRSKPKAAVLDGLLHLGPETFIIEVKLAHTERVWEQLMVRYKTLVKALCPTQRIRTVEICRSYDPSIELPGAYMKIASLHRPANTAGLEVLQWKI